jgi:hypothetical protein
VETSRPFQTQYFLNEYQLVLLHATGDLSRMIPGTDTVHTDISRFFVLFIVSVLPLDTLREYPLIYFVSL